MAKSYFYDESISDWRELVKGEQGERGPVGPIGPQGPAIDIETGLPITVDTTVGTRVFVGDVMVYGDTGWIDVIPLLMNGWTATLRVRLKRENNTVTFQVRGGAASLNGADATSSRVFTIPDGFIPSLGNYGRVGAVSGPDGSNTTVSLAEQDLTIPTGGSVMGEVRWHTTQPWPTSLPN